MKSLALFTITYFLFVYSTIPIRKDTVIISNDKDSASYTYIFSFDEEEPWTHFDDYSRRDEKLFGKKIAQQICMIDHQYIIYSQTESSYHPNIIKPAIYNSLSKLKQYYKSQLKQELIDLSTVRDELELYLIIAYICYSEETKTLEMELRNANSIEEIKEILDSVSLIKSYK